VNFSFSCFIDTHHYTPHLHSNYVGSESETSAHTPDIDIVTMRT
jgi:hypothetical protein